jgi:hypothetical protein
MSCSSLSSVLADGETVRIGDLVSAVQHTPGPHPFDHGCTADGVMIEVRHPLPKIINGGKQGTRSECREAVRNGRVGGCTA